MRNYLLVALILCLSNSIAQNKDNALITKWIEVASPIVQVDSVSILASDFEVRNIREELISPSNYDINFSTGVLTLLFNLAELPAQIQVSYKRYPDFLTK